MPTPDYLDGAVDFHVHGSPDVDPRRCDDIDLAREACRAGMSAIVLKSHQGSTVERAILAQRVVEGVCVFGGVVLNAPVGGLNTEAVRLALRMGGKQVWMPTRSARNHKAHHNQDGGISVLDPAGHLTPETVAILDLLAGTDCVLGTGHLSPKEGTALIREALRRGVRRLLVTHPEWSVTQYPFDLQKDLASEGCVMFERCYVSTTHRCGHTPISRIVEGIAAAGVDSTILSTDLGQPDTPPPAEGFRIYAGQLAALGFSASQLHTMMSRNPRSMLSLLES
ncbi:MAG: DUF6282 family protein [Bryobacteraceae bacterium]|nr:DUF6282 family protein [Bryobacteraceae bacterium]